jgi:Mg2+/Co2+ transporter CorB
LPRSRPKTIAALHPERVAFPASMVLLPLASVLKPLVVAVSWVTNGLLRLLGVNPHDAGEEQVSPEELRTIVSDPAAMIPQRHRGMLMNILDLESVTVDDIMVPRNEFVGIDLDQDDAAILEIIRSSTHTLLPVWRGDSNNIEGRAASAQPQPHHRWRRAFPGSADSGTGQALFHTREHFTEHPAAQFSAEKAATGHRRG